LPSKIFDHICRMVLEEGFATEEENDDYIGHVAIREGTRTQRSSNTSPMSLRGKDASRSFGNIISRAKSTQQHTAGY
jgi:hypothetical protein